MSDLNPYNEDEDVCACGCIGCSEGNCCDHKAIEDSGKEEVK